MMPFDAENNRPLSKLKTRKRRDCSITAKLTEEENERVITAAINESKTVSEWLRDVALKATRKESPNLQSAQNPQPINLPSRPVPSTQPMQSLQPNPLFIEMVYRGELLFELLKRLVLHTGYMTTEQIEKVMVNLSQSKQQTAAVVMKQYAPKTPSK